jgi:hypothetical protein
MSHHGPDMTERQKPVSRLRMGIVLALVLLAGIICYALSFFTPASKLWHDLFHSAGEALVVAFLLALLGDLYLRFRSSEEAVRRGVQGAISEMFGFS